MIRRERDGRLLGDNVDGAGFLGAARKHGFDPAGKRALVIGCGGVGSAISYALGEAGIVSITLSDPSTARMGAVCELLGNAFPGLSVSTQFSGLEDFDLVANASPVGMGTGAELPLSAALLATLQPDTLVADVVTSPEITPLLNRARQVGCAIQTGPEMAFAQLGHLGAFMGVTPQEILRPWRLLNTYNYSFDLVVLGSGAGGFAAAATAARRGLKVLVVEKAERFGGTSAISGGAVWL